MGYLPESVLEALAKRPFDLLDLAKKLPEGGFTWQPHPNVKSIRGVLAHMLDAEQYWVYRVLRGETVSKREVPYSTPGELEADWRPVRERTVAYLRDLPAAALTEMRTVPWDPGTKVSVEVILWHLVTHEFHHKGQVCTRLAMLGVDVPDLDLIG